jgi:hypothetical protein
LPAGDSGHFIDTGVKQITERLRCFLRRPEMQYRSASLTEKAKLLMLSAFILLIVAMVKSDFVAKQSGLFTRSELYNGEVTRTQLRIDQEISAFDG